MLFYACLQEAWENTVHAKKKVWENTFHAKKMNGKSKEHEQKFTDGDLKCKHMTR